jgi:hypothetical protein
MVSCAPNIDYFFNQILGGGGELFFPFPPTFSTRRPEAIIILNLKSDPNSIWDQDLPRNWRDIELRISSSHDFQEEFLQAPRYVSDFSTEIRSILTIGTPQTSCRSYNKDRYRRLAVQG